MVYIRATRKVLQSLPAPSTKTVEVRNALGDWFVNRFVVDRRPLLIFVSEHSLLPILEPARDVRKLPDRFGSIVGQRLLRLGVPQHLVDAEVSSMGEALVATTNNRSVVGSMVDFIAMAPDYFPHVPNWDESALHFVEAKLAATPCRCGKGQALWPEKESVELLWRTHGPGDGVDPA